MTKDMIPQLQKTFQQISTFLNILIFQLSQKTQKTETETTMCCKGGEKRLK